MEKMRPEMRRDEAAVDSELALLPLIEEKLPLAGPLRNPVYTTTNRASLHPTNGVLLVARLDGPTPEIARGLVDKALQAEADGLWGRAYFDLRSITEPGYKPGDDWIRGAAEICWRMGFETDRGREPGHVPGRVPDEPDRHLHRLVRRQRLRAVHPAHGRVHARGVCLPSAFLQRGDAAQHQPELGRPAAGQGGHHHHGLRGRALPVRHARRGGVHRAPASSIGFTFGEAAYACTTGVVLADDGGGRSALPAFRE